MAAKKRQTRVAKAASPSKPKQTKKAPKKAGLRTAASKKKASPKYEKKPRYSTEYENTIPGTAITAIVSFLLLVLFSVICIAPGGKLLPAIRNLMFGLIGRVGFYFSIPAMLYLFLINTFGKKYAVVSRSVCTILFVLFCGSLYHLAVQQSTPTGFIAGFPNLYLNGVKGYGGGVICGGFAALLLWSCGIMFSYILIAFGAILTLLGAMEITVPGLIRAIGNRPKDAWENEEQQEVRIEPSARVVNTITNKQIELRHQKKLKDAQKQELKKQQQEQKLIQQQEKAKLPPPRKAPVKSASPAEKTNPRMPDLQIPEPTPTPPAETPEKEAQPKKNFFDVVNQPTDTSPVPEKNSSKSAVHDKPASPEAPVEKSVDPDEEPDVSEATDSPKEDTSNWEYSSNNEGSTPGPDIPLPPDPPGETEEDRQKPVYKFPPIGLLKRPASGPVEASQQDKDNHERLKETLASFHIDAKISSFTRGPSVTRYDVELDKGVRLNKLTNRADDIALSLGASGVRIAAIPGKISTVGIEVPNIAVTTVSLGEVIDSDNFKNAKSRSSFAVGKDIGGSCIIGNISKMPHMLIAGTTGSGKSVCMNSIIISLLYKSGPEDVKLIMVDPKMVELGIYNGIPHLLIPVVTDPKKAAGALQWAVSEMLRRYQSMADAGVRDLESFNEIVTAEEGGEKLPQIIVIIDELADLMLVAAKEVEDSICRIAQMGRAAGIHLIIATQRPSADVITGLMKANIPSRIAFSVASAMESRIILDTQGAEKLVGKGDMLYAPIGIGKPLRVQGCFVTDSEVEKVATYVKEHYKPDYDPDVADKINENARNTGSKAAKAAAPEPEPNAEEQDRDEMFEAAVDIILETGQASVSMLQRRLKLGYARAARIVDEMEQEGIVGPFQGSKPRAILVTRESRAAMRGGHTAIGNNVGADASAPEEID